ncbi:hypothetical protein E308F_16020 [Moorella sp. E308F]|jgi:hypothetical protein|nr:hypothetical protein [Moorella sp. (in: firmicutes)]GEA15358.1 hypothetical protein E308F_16020 [Moorella sp. E308F]GEA19781.1 hypothetical protein E306M_29200 [Moorella sp. E306M]
MNFMRPKEKQALWPVYFTPHGGPRFRLIFGLAFLAGGLLCWLLVAFRH